MLSGRLHLLSKCHILIVFLYVFYTYPIHILITIRQGKNMLRTCSGIRDAHPEPRIRLSEYTSDDQGIRCKILAEYDGTIHIPGTRSTCRPQCRPRLLPRRAAGFFGVAAAGVASFGASCDSVAASPDATDGLGLSSPSKSESESESESES